MSKSIRSTSPHCEKRHVPRFHRLDINHISAIESLYSQYPFLNERVEIHMPFHRAKPTFTSQAVWVWPKFDKRPVGYLIFLNGFAPCIWYPDRQEGMTFRWLLPPTFCEKGPTVCFANILAGESVLQIEDLIIYQGEDLWSSRIFSERWSLLREFWSSLPPDQPLLAFTPRIVKPMTLEQWEMNYDGSIYWIIQPDHMRQARWFWKDTVTIQQKPIQYVAPRLKRDVDVPLSLYAYCTPYTKLALPDTYSLFTKEGDSLGLASISTLRMSSIMREKWTGNEKENGIVVEVVWNDAFRKYQILQIMPHDTPLTASSFFHHSKSSSSC